MATSFQISLKRTIPPNAPRKVPGLARRDRETTYRSRICSGSLSVREKETPNCRKSLSRSSHPRLPINMPKISSSMKLDKFFLFNFIVWAQFKLMLDICQDGGNSGPGREISGEGRLIREKRKYQCKTSIFPIFVNGSIYGFVQITARDSIDINDMKWLQGLSCR